LKSAFNGPEAWMHSADFRQQQAILRSEHPPVDFERLRDVVEFVVICQ
jgi:hypothetical protein